MEISDRKTTCHLFQTLGFRDDRYDETKGGLPRLGESELHTSKKNYVADRLRKTSDGNLKKLIEVLITESSEPSEAVSMINAVLILDNICLTIDDTGINWTGVDAIQRIENEVAFTNNENKVLDALNNARVSILVAMAWFTNEKIKETLHQKLMEGLRIELVIYKDGVNATHGVDLSEFDCIEIRGTRGGIMHNKFCVIDNQKVLTGSYNWTTNAESRNDENVFVTIDNETATKYSIEFRRLKPLIR